MTGSHLPSGVAAETVRWCEAVAAALATSAARTGGLAAGIAADWLDDVGQEWAQRTALLHRELVRDALAAADLCSAFAHRAGADNAPPPTPPVAGPGVAGPGVGPLRDRRARLGGTEAGRAQNDLGMQVAELPPIGPPG